MMSENQKRILVTGSDGFIGKALVRLLSNDPSVDLYRLSRRPASDANTIGCDLLDASAVTDVLGRCPEFNQIYHLVGSFVNDYEVAYAANVLAAKNILNALAGMKARTRVLFTGSAAEYGIVNPEDNPIPEEHPLRPISIYGFTKMIQTQLADFYSRTHDIDTVVARVFNLVGSDMSDKLFPGRVQKQIGEYKRGELQKITVGNLAAIRDYLDIEDAVKNLKTIMEYGERGGVYNVGSGAGMTIKDLLERLLREAGLDMSIVESIVMERQGRGDVPKIYADIMKLRALEREA